MKPGTAIAVRMDIIRTVFQDTFDVVSELNYTASIVSFLEITNKELRSVAYEAASMAIALNDFSTAAHSPITIAVMQGWKAFLNASENQLTHVHVGLGWAIAKQQINPSCFIKNNLHAMLQLRVLDGCGYYDGMMRQKQTIKNQVRHSYLDVENFSAYDQGIGRSIWYISKGDPLKVQQLIHSFSVERHADLWRGIGIACTFVGGYDSTVLKTLLSIAEHHSTQLGMGAAMVTKSRMMANFNTTEMELACTTWINLNANATRQLYIDCEICAKGSYEKLLLLLQKGIRNANVPVENH